MVCGLSAAFGAHSTLSMHHCICTDCRAPVLFLSMGYAVNVFSRQLSLDNRPFGQYTTSMAVWPITGEVKTHRL